MKLAAIVDLVKKAYSVWSEARAPTMGAALAYYTAFSIAPLLMVALALAGMVFGPEAASAEIAEEIEGVVGPTAAAAIQELLKDASSPSSGILATAIGFVLLLLSASSV